MALVAGGHVSAGSSVEVFSPEGKCQHLLANVPVGGSHWHIPVLAYIEGNIFACAGHSNENATVKKYFLIKRSKKLIFLKNQIYQFLIILEEETK